MRVVIAGGGSVGRFIAEQLFNTGHEVTILDNDKSNSWSHSYTYTDDPCGDDHHFMALNNSGITEGDNGTSWLRFDVVLSTPFARPVVVDFTTVAGTANASKDFIARKGKLAFLPGETMKSVRVKVVGDQRRESSEKFSLKLSSKTKGALPGAKLPGQIRDND